MNSKPILRQTLPKRMPGNNQFPGELVEILDDDGDYKFIPVTFLDGREPIDLCIMIDVDLGIYARERQVDTVYLSRDRSESLVIFREC